MTQATSIARKRASYDLAANDVHMTSGKNVKRLRDRDLARISQNGVAIWNPHCKSGASPTSLSIGCQEYFGNQGIDESAGHFTDQQVLLEQTQGHPLFPD